MNRPKTQPPPPDGSPAWGVDRAGELIEIEDNTSLTVTWLDDARDTDTRRQFRVSWGELVARLSAHVRRDTKDGPAWSPATFTGPRKKENVVSVGALVLDVDKLRDGELVAVESRLRALRLDATAHTSYSDRPGVERAWRVVIRLTRPVAADEWPTFWTAAVRHIGIPVGPESKNADRLWYLPACPLDAMPEVWAFDGAALDVDAVLAEHANLATAEQTPIERLPSPKSFGSTASISIEERAERYVDRMPAAVSGQGGSAATFKVATVLVRGFALSEPAARPILSRYSQRCDPPWSEFELDHKLGDAAKSTLPHGYLLDEDEDRPEVRKAAPAPVTRIGAIANATDLGNAERFAEVHAERFRYVADMGRWLQRSGTRWEQVQGQGPLRRAAKKIARAIYAEAATIADENRRSEVARHALKSENRQRIDAMIDMAAAEPVFEVLAADLDAKPLLLACGNGTIDLGTGELLEPNPDDLLTRGTNIPYDPGAQAPRFERFLLEVFDGRQDLVEFIRRGFGYSLTGRVDGQCFFLLHGSGCNGKSLLLLLLQALLGDCAMTAPFETFVKQRMEGGIPNDIAAMRGARLVVASEGEEGAQLAESRVKTLTGGDVVSARFMRGEFFSFRPVLKLWLATNHRPDIRGTEPAIWRRMRLVPFDVDFRGKEDPDLQRKLMLELPGILAWGVQGCRDWLADGAGSKGLDVSETVRSATEAYREDSDVFGQFLAERTNIEDHAKVSSTVLFDEYRDWCESSNRRPMNSQNFGRKMTSRGHKAQVSNGQRWHRGIEIKQCG